MVFPNGHFDVHCVKCGERNKHGSNITYKWCEQCQIVNLKTNHTNLVTGNEKIDNLIQEMWSKIKHHNDIVFEWIPYDQFYNIKEKRKEGFDTIYSAIWRAGPLYYNQNTENYQRWFDKQVALKLLNESQNLTNEILDEV